MLLISIPKPCHENWDEMSPGEQGAFCSVCAKTVVDFSTLSDDVVKDYFLQNREKKKCGRFRNDQLTSTENPLPQLLAASIPFWKKFLAIVFILFGSFISGCQSRTTGKMLLSNDDREKIAPGNTTGILMVDIQHEPDTAIMLTECTTTKGEMSFRMIEDGPPDDSVSFQIDTIEDPERIIPGQPVVEMTDSVKKVRLDENGNKVVD